MPITVPVLPLTPAPVILGPMFGNASGDFSVPLSIGALLPPGWALYLQAAYSDISLPGQVGVTNAIRVQWN